MNIIRTTAVELTTIPAVAYKQKLSTGGAGLKLQRMDTDAMAMFTLDRRTGEGVPYGKYDESLFPTEAVTEAKDLTLGLPYTSRGKIRVKISKAKAAEKDPVDAEDIFEEEDVTEEEIDKVDMVHSPEYDAILQEFLSEEGKLNYQVMNKDFIQFASRSTVVGQMIGERASDKEIVDYVVGSRATNLSGRKESLSPQEIAGLIETLDEINPRSAFKELTLHIRQQLARTK
ncbi:MAG: hypothetical protein FWG15_05340 [Propionibacteriaceae bacterium]|nr:hypothetical protein [Propionibacteriaceae bacterium]